MIKSVKKDNKPKIPKKYSDWSKKYVKDTEHKKTKNILKPTPYRRPQTYKYQKDQYRPKKAEG